jgi:hypothetical protein
MMILGDYISLITMQETRVLILVGPIPVEIRPKSNPALHFFRGIIIKEMLDAFLVLFFYYLLVLSRYYFILKKKKKFSYFSHFIF